MRLRYLLPLVCLLLMAGCTTGNWRGEEAPFTPAAQSRVSWEGFDEALLSAAIFAETNRVRSEHGLLRLRSHPRLRGAADLQAFTNALLGVSSHDNPLAGRSDAWARVRAEGLSPRRVLENVALTAVRMPKSGGSMRIRLEADGTRTPRDAVTREVLPWPTYAELARRIVQQWMDSPGHRLNLLNGDVRYLACGAVMVRGPLGGELVHTTQVFMAKKLPR